VVRLRRGSPDEEFSYGDDPRRYALRLVEEGARLLHVIDLGAALGESPSNLSIKSILEAVSVPVQVGGGVRSLRRMQELLDWGARRVLLGTKALTDPNFLEEALKRVDPKRLVVALDFREGKLRISGWKESIETDLVSLGARLRSLGLERVLVTAIERDGTFEGPDIELWRLTAEQTKLSVIGAGGIGSLEHLKIIAQRKFEGLEAVVAGRAVAEGAFTVSEAIGVLGGGRP